MGCGHSKINIYPRKSKGKHSSKKSGGSGGSHSSSGGGGGTGRSTTNGYTTSNGCEDGQQNGGGSNISEDGNEIQRNTDGNNTSEELQPLQQDQQDGGVDSGGGTKVKLKPHNTAGGPLLAHSEISESQQNFFRMLDEKIENGPDYDSSSEIEQIKENERLTSLLQDWETASAASRSLPSTPRHHPQQQNPNLHHPHHILQHQSSITNKQTQHHQMGPIISQQNHSPSNFINTAIPKQQILHQPMNMAHHHPIYGVATGGSTTIHNPAYQTYSPPHHHANIPPSVQPSIGQHSSTPLTVFSKVVPGMQYTESLSLNSQIKQNLTNFVAQRQLQIAAQAHAAAQQVQHYHHPMSVVPQSRDVASMVQNYSNNYISQSSSQSSKTSQQIISSPIHKHSRIPSVQPTQVVRQGSTNIGGIGSYNAAIPQHATISVYSSSSSPSQQSPQPVINPDYTNGELILQQQLYNQQLKSHLSKEIQQYKQSREQLLLKQQQEQQQIMVQTHAHTIQQPQQQHKPTRIMPPNPQQPQPSYQSSVEMSINRTSTTGTDPMSPKILYRKQNSTTTATSRQYSQELT